MSLDVFKLLLLALLVVVGGFCFSRKKAGSLIWVAVAVSLFLFVSAKAFVVIGTILLLMLLSTPLFVTIGLLSIACFYFVANEYQEFWSYELIIEKIFSLTDKNVLLAIPYFVIAGSMMTAGGIARRVVSFADALVGWLPGGLAAAAVLSCMFFAAISGSSPVTVIAIGSIMLPALVKAGYDEKFSVGLVTSAGSLGILIPPSIPMIIYAIVVSGTMATNVADLFIAGLLPGFLIGGILVGYSVYQGIIRPDFSFSSLKPPSLKLISKRFLDGFWALLLPVIVLGGIYPIFGPTGFFTPTEAAAVSAVYAFVVEKFIHRELELKKLPPLLVDSTIVMGSLLIIMNLSFALNHFLVDQQIPDAAVKWLTKLELTEVTFLLVLNVFLLLVGAFMDIISAILVIAPLVAPIAASFGIDPIHLGIIFVVNLEIGYLTPPIGLNLFVSASLFQKSIGFVIRSVGIFILLMLGGLMIITWYEPTSVGLVRMVRGESFFERPSKAVVDPESEEDEPQAAPEGVKSIEELMKEADGESEPPKVKSIEELMREANEADEDEDEDDEDDDAPTKAAPRVKSIEELMREANTSSSAQESED